MTDQRSQQCASRCRPGAAGGRSVGSRASIAGGLPALLFLSLAVQVALPATAHAVPVRAEAGERGTLRIVSDALVRVVRTLLHAESRAEAPPHPSVSSPLDLVHGQRPAEADRGAIRAPVRDALLNLPPPSV